MAGRVEADCRRHLNRRGFEALCGLVLGGRDASEPEESSPPSVRRTIRMRSSMVQQETDAERTHRGSDLSPKTVQSPTCSAWTCRPLCVSQSSKSMPLATDNGTRGRGGRIRTVPDPQARPEYVHEHRFRSSIRARSDCGQRLVRRPDRGAGVRLRLASLMSAVDARSLRSRCGVEITHFGRVGSAVWRSALRQAVLVGFGKRDGLAIVGPVVDPLFPHDHLCGPRN